MTPSLVTRSTDVETPRAQIVEIPDGVTLDEETGMPMMKAQMSIDFTDDRALGAARDLHDRRMLAFFMRSGLSRVGLDARFSSHEEMMFQGNHFEFMLEILSLRGATNDRILSVLQEMVSERGPGNIDIGRMSLLNPSQALTAEEIRSAIHDNELLLTPDSIIGKEGIIEVPLTQLHYLLCEPNLDEDHMRRLFLNGKHALPGVQAEARTPRSRIIKPREFFVGAIHLSLGPFIGVIERRTTDQKVFHLAARGLDGIRTTGMEIPRQVELFSEGNKPVNLDDLKVKIRLHRVGNSVGELSQRVITPSTLREGVKFHDIMQVAGNPEQMLALMNEVTSQREGEGDYGLLVAGYKCARVPWLETPEFQRHHLLKVGEELLGGERGQFLHGDQIPASARPFTRALKHVGGDQKEGAMSVTHAFPDPMIMQDLMDRGVAVFMAQNLRQQDKAFDEGDTDNQKLDLFFDSTLYQEYRRLEKHGARLYMAVPEIAVQGQEVVPAHLREFHHGFWVKPGEKERVDRVNTIIAMYGSHRDGLDEALAQGIPGFLERMQKISDKYSGEGSLGLTHGKGPGVMLLADQAAEKLGIVRVGVGIELEKLDGQTPNFRPEAFVDFKADDRLPRQKLMDDLATFKIFNIGGAGTLEEAAITMCSQKLMKNIFTPIIFVDPLHLGGVGQDGNPEHLWIKLGKLIETLSGQGTFTDEQRAMGLANLNLLRTYATKYCYFVSSYGEAGDILEAFMENPQRHYEQWGIPEKHLKDAWDNACGSAKDRGFAMPGFMLR